MLGYSALLVPVLTLFFALLTKNAYFSLMLGVFFGATVVCGFDILRALIFVFSVMGECVSGSNLRVLIFLVMLGAIVALINKTGVSQRYAQFIGSRVKTKRGVLFLTGLFSALFFLDDYFDCLTTGSIVKPIARHKSIFPGRVAHVIHSVTISFCVLVPISSWSAAISSTFADSGAVDGLSLFMKTIPFNFYAIISVVSVVAVTFFDISLFKMRREEKKHLECLEKKTLESLDRGGFVESSNMKERGFKDFFLSLVLPLIFLIVSCILCLLYTGGITAGKGIFDALSACDSSTGLLLGAVLTYVFMFFLYVPILRNVSLGDFFNAIADGLKEMSSAVVVLILAWTLGNLTSNYLKIGTIFEEVLKSNASLTLWLPLVLFLLSAVLSVSTGTSWGTFAILIPVAFPVLQSNGAERVYISSLAAILSGAAFGDNVSPISDTTIMVSASSGCDPLLHSFTQFPYAAMNAVIAGFCFFLSGFVYNVFVLLLVAFVLLGLLLTIMRKISLKC